MMNMPQDAIVLLVENRPEDVLLVHRAFAAAAIPNPPFVVADGRQAIEYLEGTGKFADRAKYPVPDLILLDLTLPNVSSFDVIRHIRNKYGPSCPRIVVLTTPEGLPDVNQAYSLGANSYLVKPDEFEDRTCIIRILSALR